MRRYWCCFHRWSLVACVSSPDGRAPADSALGPLGGRLLPEWFCCRTALFPEVTPDDSKQWLSSDSRLTWKYEAVIPAVGFIVSLVHELSTDEGFSSQSVTRATASSSSWGVETSTEDWPLGSQRGASVAGFCNHSGWSLAGGLVSTSSYSGHPSSPNLTVFTVKHRRGNQRFTAKVQGSRFLYLSHDKLYRV